MKNLMKSFFFAFSFLLVTLLPTQQANAQLDVIINPVEFITGDLSVGIDYVFSEKFSVDAFLNYGTKSSVYNQLDRQVFKGTVSAKVYFNPVEGADKWYASIFLRDAFRNYVASENGSEYSDYTSNRFSAGFGAGYKFVGSNNIVFDIGIGVGRVLASKVVFADETLLQDSFAENNVILIGKLGIGYRFGGGK